MKGMLLNLEWFISNSIAFIPHPSAFLLAFPPAIPYNLTCYILTMKLLRERCRVQCCDWNTSDAAIFSRKF
jgi:hypothetical protein